MGGLAGLVALSADAIMPMDRRRLLRGEMKVNRKAVSRGFEVVLPVVCHVRFGHPSIDPHAESSRLSARLAKRSAAEFFGVPELRGIHVCQREVSEIEMANGPAGRIRLVVVLCNASSEKRQLVTKSAALL